MILSGNDTDNLFGLGAGADLTGQAITGTFAFYSDSFGAYYNNAHDTALNALGGPVFGYPIVPNPAEVTETINGNSVTFFGVSQSAFVFQNCTTDCADNYTGFGLGVSDVTNTFGTIVDFVYTHSTTTIISDIHDLGTLAFNSIDGNPLSNAFPWGGETFFNGTGSGTTPLLFSLLSETVGPGNSYVEPPPHGPPPGVPEPEVWMMLVGGFFMVGSATRGRDWMRQCS